MILKIPEHGFPQAALEAFPRHPAKLGFDFAGVDSVSQIMSGPVGHEFYQPFIWQAGGGRSQLVEMRTNALYDVDVPPFGIPADIIGLADAPSFQHRNQRASMILDIEPISHVLAFAVYRQRLALERPYYGEGNQL